MVSLCDEKNEREKLPVYTEDDDDVGLMQTESAIKGRNVCEVQIIRLLEINVSIG